MPKNVLQQHLTELHTELASASELDPALRRQLRDVAADIEALLGEEAADEQTSTADQLRQRLRQATVEFEAEHPRFAAILGDLADTLTKLGI